MNDISNYLLATSLGILRGVVVTTLIHPLHVIKTRQQTSSSSLWAHRIAQKILKEEGRGALYLGLNEHLAQNFIQQIWRWPLMMGMPTLIEKRMGINSSFLQQSLTGIAIASTDALFTQFLESEKILKMTKKAKENDLAHFWRAMGVNWGRLSFTWTIFLYSQQTYRDAYRKRCNRDQLSVLELALIGTGVALTVGISGAALDHINSSVQSRSSISWRALMRGGPLYTTILVVHNAASVTLIDKLSPLFKKS